MILQKNRGGATEKTHYCSRTFENATWQTHAVYEALAARPDVRLRRLRRPQAFHRVHGHRALPAPPAVEPAPGGQLQGQAARPQPAGMSLRHQHAHMVRLQGLQRHGHLAGTPESIDKLTLKQVHAFYARHYRPGNAHLIVVGCIEPEATLAEIRRAFGAIEKGGTAAPPPLVPALHEWRLAEQVESKQDLAPGKAAVLAYPLPPADSPDRWALLVLGKLLTGSRTNRLEADLVKERHDAFAAGLQLTQLRRGGALFFWAAYLPYRRKQTAFKMLTAASERLSKLEWLTEDSLASAKARELAPRANLVP